MIGLLHHAPAAGPHVWHASAWFLNAALCIHRGESGDFHYGPSRHPRTRTWNGYYNGWQFTSSTWQRANRLLHRHDDPQWSSPRIQLWHVWAIWHDDGGSFREWPDTSRACGLR